MDSDLTSKRVVKNLLRAKAIRPSKRMGQHFLVQRTVLRKVIESSELKPGDIVLEIGAGMGTLTRELAQRVKKVVAVEKDPKLTEILREILKDFQNVEIVQGDILKIKNLKLEIKNYKVVANLPYYIATEVIRKFIESTSPPKLMVLMVQKEVGKRICSEPPRMQRLAVLVQVLAKVKISGIVKKDSFWPPPKVDSVILKIVPRLPRREPGALLRGQLRQQFARIVKAGFSHPRKQLVNNLAKVLNRDKEKIEKWFKKNNIQLTQRAESLSLEDWLNLTKTFK